MDSGFIIINWVEAEYFKTGWNGYLSTLALCLGGGFIAGGLFWMVNHRNQT